MTLIYAYNDIEFALERLTFLTLWLTFHSVVHFSTACSKIAWSVCPLCEQRQGDVFSFHWQQYL